MLNIRVIMPILLASLWQSLASAQEVSSIPMPVECTVDQTTIEQYSRLEGYVNVCTDLMINQTAQINFFEAKRCINEIGTRFREIDNQSCKDKLVELPTGHLQNTFAIIFEGYLNNRVLTSDGSGGQNFNWDNGLERSDPDFVGYVENYFSLVGAWYRQTRGVVYPLSASDSVMNLTQEEFLEDEILKEFWDALQNYESEWKATFGQLPPPPEPAQEEKLFQIFQTMLSINSRVIRDVFASELQADLYEWVEDDASPGPSPILAIIVGDTLAPFYERVRTLTKIFDIACKINSCDEDFYEDNETVWMLRFFEQLGKGVVIPGINFDENDTRPLALFLGELSGNGEALKKTIEKINDVFGVSNIVSITPGTDFPHFLQSFYKVFAESQDLISSFEATKEVQPDGTVKAGFFHGGNVYEVNVGFGKVNMDQHIASVKTVNSQLDTLSQSFIGQHNQLINQTLSINTSEILLSDLEDKINIDVSKIMDLKNQIDSIREFIQEQRSRFGSKVRSIIDNLGSGADSFDPIGSTTTFQVAASTSSQGTGSFTDIGKVALSEYRTDPIDKGDMLRITVLGEYQPTCAITEVYGQKVKQAKTGSRGFNLNFVNGQSQVQSTNRYKSKSSFSSNTTTVSACAGTQEPIFGFIDFEVCNTQAFGTRRESGVTTSNVGSSSTRSDASFDLGLTVENTPYPDAPAGALLLVEMPIGESNKYRYKSLRVLNGNDTVISTKDQGIPKLNTEYYFVVNDCGNGAGVGQLDVSVEQYRARSANVVAFTNKVTAMIPAIEDEVGGLVENGVLSQSTLLRLKKELAGDETGGVGMASFSGNIRTLLEAFLDSQINILDYKSIISNMERDMQVRKATLDSLLEHYQEESQQKRLKISQRNWNLANMDLDFVNKEGTNRNLYTLNRVINILEHSLVSYLDFRYDEERKRAIVGDIDLLTRLDFTSPFDDIALNMTTFMTALLDNLEDDLNNRPVTPKLTMGIHIPNPHYVKPPGFPDPVYHFPKMDDFRAAQFWDAIYSWKRGDAGAEINFDVIFEDLYNVGGLGCYVEAPIIDSMAMYFIPENEGYITDFNNLYRHRNAKMLLKGLSDIPFENNVRHYNFVNKDWRFMDSGVRMAKSPRDAINRLATEFPPNAPIETGLGTGRSPFGFFQIGDIPAYRIDEQGDADPANDIMMLGDTPLDEIKELFIGFNFAASSNDFTVNLSWLEDYCGSESGLYWQLVRQGIDPTQRAVISKMNLENKKK